MKVLFVDDEPSILRAYERLFRKNFTVCTAATPQEGLTAIRNEDIAVVVSDMRMPEMNGVEFLAKAKEISPASIQILLTGNPTDPGDYENDRYFRCLQKPCDRKHLQAILNEASAAHMRLATTMREHSSHVVSATA